jgi:hypothetical protein
VVVHAWVVCPGPRTLSEVWQATGLAAKRRRDLIYSLFRSARWDWDELAKVLLLLLVARLAPTGCVWLAVDDTLAHKRGRRVAFGGFFLDAVTSTRKWKNFPFGLNWVVLGLSVHLPFRPDRPFCLPVLWRLYKKAGEGRAEARSRTDLAAEMARLAASWLPGRASGSWPIAPTSTRCCCKTGRPTCTSLARSAATPACTPCRGRVSPTSAARRPNAGRGCRRRGR